METSLKQNNFQVALGLWGGGHILTYMLHGPGKCKCVSDMNKCAFMCLDISRRHGYGVFLCATTTTWSASGYSVQDTGGHDQYFTHCMIMAKHSCRLVQVVGHSLAWTLIGQLLCPNSYMNFEENPQTCLRNQHTVAGIVKFLKCDLLFLTHLLSLYIKFVCICQLM